MSWARQHGADVVLMVLVQPKASRTRVVGEHDGRLKIALTAPPVDGQANAMLVEFVAAKLGLNRKSVQLTQGATSRRKELTLREVEVARAKAALVT